MKIRSVIKGVGGYLPPHVVTNYDLSKTIDTNHEWIEKRTGICMRHIAAPEEHTSILALHAAKMALSNAGLEPQEINLIILATSTPDNSFPATASRVQADLLACNAVAFDINVACSGFLVAFIMADSYLRTSHKRYALIIGAETISRLVDWSDRKTAILFGDGAGAVVISAEPSERGLIDHCLFSDGSSYDLLYVSPNNTQNPGVIIMDGKEVFRKAVQQMVRSTRILLKQTNTEISDIDWLISHQANKRILDAVGENLEIPLEKVIFTGVNHGNTSAASIPLALWESYSNNKIKKGELVLMQSFGAGFTWGACLVRA